MPVLSIFHSRQLTSSSWIRMVYNNKKCCFLDGSGSWRKKPWSARTCKKCWTSGTIGLTMSIVACLIHLDCWFVQVTITDDLLRSWVSFWTILFFIGPIFALLSFLVCLDVSRCIGGFSLFFIFLLIIPLFTVWWLICEYWRKTNQTSHKPTTSNAMAYFHSPYAVVF